MSTAVMEPKAAHPIVVLEQQIDERSTQFAAALPAHIPVERFKRVVLTAVQNNPGLIRVERRSFFTSCMKAAQDGLLPDGREAALVEYKDRERGLIAQYMPMIAGIRKKVRNSGEIVDWNAYVVYENDEFDYQLGDDPFIKHKPLLSGDRGKLIAAYSVATLKGGEKSREVMSITEIEKVKNVSRSKNSQYGPWAQWFEEMARKTVARRHSKVLPMSTDLDDLIRNDDTLYDLNAAREEAQKESRRPTLSGMLDAIAETPSALIEHDPTTGEVTESAEPGFGDLGASVGDGAGRAASAAPAPEQPSKPETAAEPPGESGEEREDLAAYRKAGFEAGRLGRAKSLSRDLRGDDNAEAADAWLEGHDAGRAAAGGEG